MIGRDSLTIGREARALDRVPRKFHRSALTSGRSALQLDRGSRAIDRGLRSVDRRTLELHRGQRVLTMRTRAVAIDALQGVLLFFPYSNEASAPVIPSLRSGQALSADRREGSASLTPLDPIHPVPCVAEVGEPQTRPSLHQNRPTGEFRESSLSRITPRSALHDASHAGARRGTRRSGDRHRPRTNLHRTSLPLE